MFNCTVYCLNETDNLFLEQRIVDLETQLNSVPARGVVDQETRAEIVHSVASRMGRVAYVRRLSVEQIKRKCCYRACSGMGIPFFSTF